MRTLGFGILVLSGFSIAFNSDDNKNGYTGKCPSGYRSIDHFCYRPEDHETDFRGALKKCVKNDDDYYMQWKQGSRWLGPKYNLMPVELLHPLQGRNLGRGPYRYVWFLMRSENN